MSKNTGAGRWQELDAKRRGMLTRSERYAELTIPSCCPEDHYNEGTDELSHSLNSVGAQAVNNLVNKMILAMFAPSRPFMRFELPRKDEQEILDALQLDKAAFREEMAIVEMDAVKELDAIGARPKLFDLMMHLIVTGNCLRYMDGDVMRIIGIKDFVSRRNAKGEVVEIILRERVQVDELPPEIQVLAEKGRDLEAEIDYYRWWKWDGKVFQERQFLDAIEVMLPKYRGQYKREDMPAQHHVWRIADKSNYGIGHVEDSIGDLEGLDQLSEAEVNGAILASEFRWLANPGGMTRPEDIKTSRNGDVIPGSEGDLTLISAGPVAASIQIVSACAEKYIRRIGGAFMLTSGVQRDAERVTAEEIRLLAQELETGLGGIYSRLAIDLQLPLAWWLMNRLENKVFDGTDFRPVIVTGLDALSRNGDLENMQLFLQDVIGITTMPPEVQQYLKLDSIFSALAAGRGLRSSEYVNNQSTVDQRNAAAQQAAQEQQTEQFATQTAIENQGK